ncbi:hypothetical protein [Cryobacterium glucosi]|uniref:Uncharacterized protein n=1 Tax=Cryobacterium glucosi TaxID=1259175 RepID=A0ABY2IPL6_9MICO|nr:hypothetical protein [Cryobacterium glucosi]TFC21867.1 hypothetical protein E3O46_06610 [Cryobacterium glucosi]
MDFESFGGWWTSQAWGSVPDWIAAIATTGALFWAFLLFSSDRIRASQAEANRFTAYIVSTTHEGTFSTAKFEFFNAGDTPVPLAYLITCQATGNSGMPLTADGGYIFRPGSRTSFRTRLERHSNDTFNYVYFQDSHGRTWLRDIATGKYVSLRRQTRGPWLRYKGSPKARWDQFVQNHQERPPRSRQ